MYTPANVPSAVVCTFSFQAVAEHVSFVLEIRNSFLPTALFIIDRATP